MDNQQPQVQKQPQQFIQPLFQDAFQRNLIKDILNPEDILEFIENTLKGMKLNSEGVWEKDDKSKPLKREGIFKILRILRSHLNKYQTLANLSESDIIRLGRDIRLNIIEIIYEEREDFVYEGENVEEESDLALCTSIVLLIDHNIFANLTRAKNGGESKLLRTVYRSQDSISDISRSQEMQPQGNFLSNLFKRRQPPPMQQQGGY